MLNKSKKKSEQKITKQSFNLLLFKIMARIQSNTWQEKEKRAEKTRKMKENWSIYSKDDRRARGLDALNKYIAKQMKWKPFK